MQRHSDDEVPSFASKLSVNVKSRPPLRSNYAMASLRTQSTARLLRAASSAQVALSAAPRRFQHTSATPPVPTGPAESNQPNYNVTQDKATSTYTPVPKRVQDGSEEGILPAAVISGAPMELQGRTVRIYKETKPATQSGHHRGDHWRMDWDILPRGHRWENPLMGWQSSGDFMQGSNIHFESKEDAIRFAERQGYEYFVQEPNSRKVVPKAYANNFLYSDKKLKIVRTK
ncbi:NADH-ubiquinone oxidoreductase 21 kDa subunit-like protein [Hapsidospora chrysogenum ATCC 11550]|uniref:NADH dehydrogenase [ubiquinone] iron-sulfur protein 4, mitochondrial n=1 Tax=Hapsidospora chrysogenum (strain ATCC 11550 / CBS 779.69 / DSM 880 / IAM 14645 / JCM 23072 / IMI 49137) TaxID=857340 RepID=A0A086SY91_HAPC1|nr:NADH-ubiquinone oxidoreductase 21 kDa subunit-like protein [Hapsidospora chrysogenum ATCC 11550]